MYNVEVAIFIWHIPIGRHQCDDRWVMIALPWILLIAVQIVIVYPY